MKKLVLSILSLALVLTLTSCMLFGATELEGKFEGYYYEISDGIKSVTNYHPYNLFALPTYQEMIQYGDGAGLENDDTVYFIYVVDTKIDPDSPKAYYCAELDAVTREILCEEGEYFTNEQTKNETIERLLAALDSVN